MKEKRPSFVSADIRKNPSIRKKKPNLVKPGVIDADLPGLETEVKIDLLRKHFPHGLIVLSSTKPETSAIVTGVKDVLFFDKSSPSEFLLQLLPKE